MVIEFNKSFSGLQPRQSVFPTFRELPLFNLQGVFLVLPKHQHTLKMGTELAPETSQNLHTLTQLSAREDFIEVDTLLTDSRRDMKMPTHTINNIKTGLKINRRFLYTQYDNLFFQYQQKFCIFRHQSIINKCNYSWRGNTKWICTSPWLIGIS